MVIAHSSKPDLVSQTDAAKPAPAPTAPPTRPLSERILDALDRATRVTGRLEQREATRGPLRKSLARFLHFGARGTRHVVRNRRYITARKLANMGLINLQARLLTERVVGRPYRIKIEPTNICNSSCWLCPTGQKMYGREFGRMKLEDFKKLVDRVSSYATVLDLGNWGEPLLVPDIFEMVRYAHNRGIWTNFATNLHALRPEEGRADELVLSGVDRIACSFHGTSQQTFEIFQPGKQFGVALANLKAIIEAKQRLNRRNPDLLLVFVPTKYNQHERPEFERLCASLGADPVYLATSVNVRLLGKGRDMEDLGWSEEERNRRMKLRFDRWLPDDPDYVVEPYRLMAHGRYRPESYNGHKVFDCRSPWTDMLINWDGGVAPCPGVFGSSHDLGNVFEDSIPEIWNSPNYRTARRSFKRPTEQSDDIDNPCRECPGYCV